MKKHQLRKLEDKAKRIQDFKEYYQAITKYKEDVEKARVQSWIHTVNEDLKDISATAKMHKFLSKEHINKLGTLLTSLEISQKMRKKL